MKKLLLTVFMLLVMSTSCLAANWEWVGSSPDLGIFYDKDSIVFEKNKQIVNRDRCSVWVKIVYDKAYVQREYKQDWAFSVERWNFDLANNRIREGERLHYNDNGRVVNRDKPSSKWNDIAPETLAELIRDRVSKYAHERTEEIEQRTRNAH